LATNELSREKLLWLVSTAARTLRLTRQVACSFLVNRAYRTGPASRSAVAIQGTSLAPVARWLGLERPRATEPPITLEINSLRHVNGKIVDYAAGTDSRAAGRMVKDLALPEGAVIALIARGDQIVPPQGNTSIHVDDHIILVLRPGIRPLVNQVFGRNSDVRGMIPSALEFPLRALTTVQEIQELYAIPINSPPERTLGEVMCHELGSWSPPIGEAVRFGPLMFRVLRLSGDNRIELIGMSLLAGEVEETHAQR
jgi:cell volume regulation protein A